ncbi:hypothetical protein ACVILI_001686 [Mesorhizobium sp. USDA 4775]
MPELLDFGDVDLAEIRQRLFGEPRRDADAQAAGDQLDDGEARRNAGAVEQAGQHFRSVRAACRLQFGHDLAERRLAVGDLARRPRPDQRHRFGEIADIVVGVAEQHGIHPFCDQHAQHGRLDRGYCEVTGDGRQRQPAIRILDGSEIVDQQRQLAVARRRQHKAVEKFCEAVHGFNRLRPHSPPDAAAGRRCLRARTSEPALPRGHASPRSPRRRSP